MEVFLKNKKFNMEKGSTFFDLKKKFLDKRTN